MKGVTAVGVVLLTTLTKMINGAFALVLRHRFKGNGASGGIGSHVDADKSQADIEHAFLGLVELYILSFGNKISFFV